MSFRFRQFTVADDRCAMKVGTDAVLLGCWCPIGAARKILDIGTGSGVIALIAAQRSPEAHIDAIDIDAEAVKQSQDNFRLSPWAERLTGRHISLQEWSAEQSATYDLIISNPPYFVDSLKNPDPGRQTARHTDTLSYEVLIASAARLLQPQGVLALILPAEAETQVIALARAEGLSPTRLTRVHSKPGKPAKRILIALRKGASETMPTAETLYIESAHSPRSEEYAELTRDFYL